MGIVVACHRCTGRDSINRTTKIYLYIYLHIYVIVCNHQTFDAIEFVTNERGGAAVISSQRIAIKLLWPMTRHLRHRLLPVAGHLP